MAIPIIMLTALRNCLAIESRYLSMTADDLLQGEFVPTGEILRARANELGGQTAISDDAQSLSWREMDERIDRIAAKLQAEGVGRGDVVAIAGYNCVAYALILLAVSRAGAASALLTVSATGEALASMVADSGAGHLFFDAPAAEKLPVVPDDVKRVAFEALDDWMAASGSVPAPVAVEPDDPFFIIYSSGTTGTPKGIVQSHAMRINYMRRAPFAGYDSSAICLISTPLYSNTTLVGFLPALGGGASVILMPRFDARRFCEIAEARKVTHATLVPVQYQRIMALPDFDSFDLSSFRYKSSTSAPFQAELMADVVRRWPGRLVEFYGMTEGGMSCILEAEDFPDKLHTVGRPSEGHEIRFIDEDGEEVPPGEVGEIVGRSPTMMNGYHGLPELSRNAEWYDREGRRFIRHGDLGRLDEDGFVILMGRRKDLILSGGFNIYPDDLEAELLRHPAVDDASVIGAPSDQWGETPVGFVVLRDDRADLAEILADANSRLGKTQRISALHRLDRLPRSAIGKVLKRELRELLDSCTSLD